MVSLFTVIWQTPTSGSVVSTGNREVFEVRLATWGDARVRARRDWYEDRTSLRPGQAITFSQLQQRTGGLRIRFKFEHHPKADWEQERIDLTPQPQSPAASRLSEDPWSLGARRRAQLEREARERDGAGA